MPIAAGTPGRVQHASELGGLGIVCLGDDAVARHAVVLDAPALHFALELREGLLDAPIEFVTLARR
jgi:hypothetical protein